MQNSIKIVKAQSLYTINKGSDHTSLRSLIIKSNCVGMTRKKIFRKLQGQVFSFSSFLPPSLLSFIFFFFFEMGFHLSQAGFGLTI